MSLSCRGSRQRSCPPDDDARSAAQPLPVTLPFSPMITSVPRTRVAFDLAITLCKSPLADDL